VELAKSRTRRIPSVVVVAKNIEEVIAHHERHPRGQKAVILLLVIVAAE